MQQQQKLHDLSEELINEILAYLGGRPYVEVNLLIQKIFKEVDTNKEAKNVE